MGAILLEQGYIVYIVDAPCRGRASALVPEGQESFIFSAEKCESVFAGKDNDAYTQWPGECDMNTPVFDAFYATVVPSLVDNRQMQIYIRNAGAALLDKIGPAVSVNHSQSGAFGWLIADERPNLVKGLLQLDPKGPPFQKAPSRPEHAVWGLTEIPMAYDPPVHDYTELEYETYAPESDDATLKPGNIQKEPARKLINLVDIPILIITGSMSYHRPYEHVTVKYLKQAGVKSVTHIPLWEHGILGNAHFMMLEKNSLEIAKMAHNWLEETVDIR
jgi:pimeloyl-ACP methyl ester carboxylesterase